MTDETTDERYEIDELHGGNAYFRFDEKTINPLQQAINDLSVDMLRFNKALDDALSPQKKYLTETEYRIYNRGKKIRPVMLILSARLLHGDETLPDKVIKASVSLEMLHVASLIHDDIIDNALLRRGLQSVNASRGTNTAILVGDLQFLQAIRNFIDAIETESEMGLVKMVLDSAFGICTGELDEIQTDPNWSPGKLKQRYLEVIERKTAIMFGLACETGVALVGGRSADARRLGFYGRRVGRAFQIMDDILDFLQKDTASGKETGIDLVQRRLSLPIIYAMEELGDEHYISRYIRKETDSLGSVQDAIKIVKETSALSSAYADARYQALDALEYLKPFAASPYKKTLDNIATYIVDRSF
ncbi:hypothetical protein MNBD_GAMMA09-3630 [hydrothermal vent metagenome]|uniref:Uncharacterized protein n=1 Tax=hydrothermal vent metagenome TaxID=652676 RepID=A0A3B0Y119_9ZZZZ